MLLQSRIFVLLLLGMLLAACGGASPATPNVEANDNDAVMTSAPQANADEVSAVAQVNDVLISRAAFERARQRLSSSNAADPAALDRQILENLIEQELINQGAAMMEITITEADVMDEINLLKEAAGSTAQWQAWLSENGFTEAELIVEQEATLKAQAVRDAISAQYLEEDVEQVHARHILVASEETARDIMTQLSNNGDFSALAAQYSLDATTRNNGGDLGWFTRVELIDTDLADLAFELEIGQTAGPIRTALGYHIIQTIEKAQRPIEPQRLPLLQQNAFNVWLLSQYENATIERYL